MQISPWFTLKCSIGLMLLMICGVAIGGSYYYLKTPINPQLPEQALRVTIPKGASFHQVLNILKQEQLLQSPKLFHAYAYIQQKHVKIKAGEFQVYPHWTPPQLLDHLVEGKSLLYRFTIPEGLALREILQRLEEAGFAKAEQFDQLQKDPQFIQSLGLSFPVTSLEGLLFPETYFFTKSDSPEQILKTMVDHYKASYTSKEQQRAKELGLSDYDVLILASIVEKETALEADRPFIAAVFHNRLKKRMRLESDPTVIYGVPNFDGNLTRKHLKTRTPYNTYRIRGLPPTPICSPGEASIQSVLYPADSNYVFFVAKGDGSSHFSSTLKAHNRAVYKYQKRRRRRK